MLYCVNEEIKTYTISLLLEFSMVDEGEHLALREFKVQVLFTQLSTTFRGAEVVIAAQDYKHPPYLRGLELRRVFNDTLDQSSNLNRISDALMHYPTGCHRVLKILKLLLNQKIYLFLTTVTLDERCLSTPSRKDT